MSPSSVMNIRLLEKPIGSPVFSLKKARYNRFRSTRRRLLMNLNAVTRWDVEKQATLVVTQSGLWMDSERFISYFFPQWWSRPSHLGRSRRVGLVKAFNRDPLAGLLHFGFRHAESRKPTSGERQGKGAQS